jgi:hypothetical protein
LYQSFVSLWECSRQTYSPESENSEIIASR